MEPPQHWRKQHDGISFLSGVESKGRNERDVSHASHQGKPVCAYGGTVRLTGGSLSHGWVVPTAPRRTNHSRQAAEGPGKRPLSLPLRPGPAVRAPLSRKKCPPRNGRASESFPGAHAGANHHLASQEWPQQMAGNLKLSGDG